MQHCFGGRAAVEHIAPGPNPPTAALAEVYNVPTPYFGMRGADIHSRGGVGVDG